MSCAVLRIRNSLFLVLDPDPCEKFFGSRISDPARFMIFANNILRFFVLLAWKIFVSGSGINYPDPRHWSCEYWYGAGIFTGCGR
jgi:hypothetical protein